eukprot:m.246737 g.246737  ORF g.246737 m.246737 type:complete len:158 (+) comp17153_c0_seq12:3594-4067(+)
MITSLTHAFSFGDGGGFFFWKYPLETDRQVLDLYITSLHLRKMETDSFLYRLSIHHTAAFLFQDFGAASKEAQAVFKRDQFAGPQRTHAIRRMILAMPDDVLGDVLRYTADLGRERLVVFPLQGDIPHSRLEQIAGLPGQDRQYQAALQHKHLISTP